jgi:CRP/FNR family transcriptional regulator, cyclic AMP receptor protein
VHKEIAGTKNHSHEEQTMTASRTSPEVQTRLEDVLAHLPVSSTIEYRKGQMIYGPGRVSKSIYLVVSGKVMISQIAEDRSEVLLEIVRPDELFGESAFLDVPHYFERTRAMETAKLMTWPTSDIEGLVMKRPRLAVALLQILAQRNADLTRRIESFSIDTIERRLARSLIRFSDRLGTPEADGAVRMMPFTHVLLAQYVGTSREIVTYYMNRFRKHGYVDYSRHGILLHCDALRTVLDKSRSGAAGAS